MSRFAAVIDSTSEDATNIQLDLSDGVAYRITGLDMPEPKVRSIYAGNFDTEGSLPASEHGYENREIALTLKVTGTSASDLETQLGYLKQKQGKINREGGTLRVTLPSGAVITFDLVEAAGAEALVTSGLLWVEGTLSFVARPFWRGAEVTFSAVAETTLPWVITTAGSIKGDVPAIARLVVTDASGSDQAKVIWGVQSLSYDTATTAALAYEAEGRTPLGGAATAVGATGASGGGSNVVRQGTLTGMPQAMLSTQTTGGGAHLTHVGSFNVLARVFMPTTNTGAVSLALEWALGDFRRRTTNDWVDFDANHGREGQYVIVRLGQVHIPDGTARWEGRIVASSMVAGDDLDVDWLVLVPITEGSGELSSLLQVGNPTAFSARDEFDQTAGNLTGKTLPVGGGNWAAPATADATDFTMDTTNHVATRNAASDTGTVPVAGRLVFAPPALTNVLVGATVEAQGAGGLTAGGLALDLNVVARYVDADNHVRAGLRYSGSGVFPGTTIVATVFVAGAPIALMSQPERSLLSDVPYDLRLMVLDTGFWALWVAISGQPLAAPIAQGYRSEFATGGALASGKAGLYDTWTSTGTFVRTYEDFFASVPTKDAAVFASQSLELTHEGATREDSAGAFSTPVSSVRGDYFKLMPAGREGRVNRLIVKASRNDIDTMSDPAIDDLTVQMFATPRGVSIPTP